jgi:3-oxoacyl-[acyl-carrier protein] reductase
VADIDEPTATQTAQDIIKAGGNALAVKVNVADRASVQGLVKATIEKFTKIDILVNNAGITRDSMLAKMTDEQWNMVMDINLKSLFFCCQEALKVMVEKVDPAARCNGKIINISSIVAKAGNVGQANYAATKAGVVGFTKSVAKEYASKKILVNAIQPGFIKTPMTDKIPEKVVEKFLAVIPLATMGLPNDIANAVLFLASPMSDYVTGTVVEVAGGFNM